ncbi:hypothetical protein FEP81_05290 [Burkholderia multivorans]|nr:hypothetical protein [Burkholderia multivorans]
MLERRQRRFGECAQIGILAVARLALEQRDRLAVCIGARGRDVRDVEVVALLAAQRLDVRVGDLLGLRLDALARGELGQLRVRLAVVGDHPLRERAHVGRLRLLQRELARLHFGLAAERRLVDELGVGALRRLRDAAVGSGRARRRVHDAARHVRIRCRRLARHLCVRGRRQTEHARGGECRDRPVVGSHSVPPCVRRRQPPTIEPPFGCSVCPVM